MSSNITDSDFNECSMQDWLAVMESEVTRPIQNVATEPMMVKLCRLAYTFEGLDAAGAVKAIPWLRHCKAEQLEDALTRIRANEDLKQQLGGRTEGGTMLNKTWDRPDGDKLVAVNTLPADEMNLCKLRREERIGYGPNSLSGD